MISKYARGGMGDWVRLPEYMRNKTKEEIKQFLINEMVDLNGEYVTEVCRGCGMLIFDSHNPDLKIYKVCRSCFKGEEE